MRTILTLAFVVFAIIWLVHFVMENWFLILLGLAIGHG
jgi:hypothetical protein